MKFIETKAELPKAELLNSHSGTYHLILIEGFGTKLAMFLEDENGEKGWYSDYTSKIFRNVIYWCRIVSE
jgi:hypothetical protein